PAPPATSPLSLHDALPISTLRRASGSQKPISASTRKRARGLARRAAPTDALTSRAYAAASGSRLANGPRYGSFQSSKKRRAKRRSEEHTSELQSRSDLVCR